MKEDYLARGFQKIHDDLAFLMNCFREVLQELGEQHLADNLPWINQVRIDPTPNPRLCQAYSIAFQFLNMVEENVAAQVRRARESVYLFAREVGLWVETPDGPGCQLHVVPLFETIEDLEIAPAVTQKYLSNAFTRRSLALQREARDGSRLVQQV